MNFIRKATEFNPSKRFQNATEMQKHFERVMKKTLRSKKKRPKKRKKKDEVQWITFQKREFEKRFKKSLNLKYFCLNCDGPLNEFMRTCPWCGDDKNSFREATTFSQYCPRCEHGLKI